MPTYSSRASKHLLLTTSSFLRLPVLRRQVRTIALAVLTMLAVRAVPASPALQIPVPAPATTPFTSLLGIVVDDPAQLAYVTFAIQPKPGSVTRPVQARYSADYLRQRNYIDAQTGAVTVPVFGLYCKYDNLVTIQSAFLNGSSEIQTTTITTPNYTGDLHKHPQVVQARTADTTLSYDFFLLKNYESANDPLIIDTDGEIRWHGNIGAMNLSSILYKNSIYTPFLTSVVREDFDGTTTVIGDYSGLGVTGWTHNFEAGRDGIIAEPNLDTYIECSPLEFDPVTGQVLHFWNLATIISAAMTAGGDDPTQFVKVAPDDWFHINSTTYRASDNTLIVSSRENFVIALDYDTQAIKWILGDPSKYWYQFPSLRKYALNVAPHSKVPIGQHAVSIVRDRLLLFDDGYGSTNQPYPGKSRLYSAARKYLIDTTTNTATETWNYTDDKMIYSPICSSVYEDQPHNLLLDYATSEAYAFAELMGFNAAGEKVFDYKYPETEGCGSGWNAVPLHLENMVFN